jgi:hypothetical protein
LVATTKALRESDPRGSVPELLALWVDALGTDRESVDAIAFVCRTVFSGAQDALPAVADIFEQGIIRESLCAADTLVYGCSGGDQPACASNMR